MIEVGKLIGLPYDHLFELDVQDNIKEIPIDNSEYLEANIGEEKSDDEDDNANKSENDEDNNKDNKNVNDDGGNNQKKSEENRDNRNLFDTNTAQKLDTDQIKEMKDKGLEGEEIIKKLITSSQTFVTKTVFSQAKYVKKKKQKHLIQFKIYRTSTDSLVEAYFNKNPAKINYFRHDSLSLFLHYASIRPNSKVLIFEQCAGLLLGAIAQKMCGLGKLTVCTHKKHKQNFSEYKILREYNIDADCEKIIEFTNLNDLIEKDPQKKFTHLLIASDALPLDILQIAVDYLIGAAPIVIFSQFLEPLGDCFEFLQEKKLGLNMHIHEIFTREYQVLPLRTHPHMRMAGFSGYVMEATRVLQ